VFNEIMETRNDYDENVRKWAQIDCCIEGEQRVKRERERYLPFPIAYDDDYLRSDDYKREYEVYLNGAHFTNYTGQMVDDLVAGVFRRNPIITDMPTELEYLNLDDVLRETVERVTADGRAFLLATYPRTEGRLTIAQEKEKGIFASISIFKAKDVINWREGLSGNKRILERVVIKGDFDFPKEFDARGKRTLYMELMLKSGTYTIQYYDEDGDKIGDEIVPVAGGKPLNEIPGVFVGVKNNTAKIDDPPILGISNSNIKHYQTWAELSHVQTYIGHPMLMLTGAPDGFIEAVNKGKKRINVGASRGLAFEGEAAKADILEINGSSLVHFKTLEQLERSMLDQGARLRSHQVTGGAETAEAIKLRNAADISTMASIATQTQLALAEMVKYCGIFMEVTVPETFSIDLNKIFVDEPLDPQAVSTLDSLVNSNKVPISVLYDYLRRTGFIGMEVSDDDLLTQAQEYTPTMPTVALPPEE